MEDKCQGAYYAELPDHRMRLKLTDCWLHSNYFEVLCFTCLDLDEIFCQDFNNYAVCCILSLLVILLTQQVIIT